MFRLENIFNIVFIKKLFEDVTWHHSCPIISACLQQVTPRYTIFVWYNVHTTMGRDSLKKSFFLFETMPNHVFCYMTLLRLYDIIWCAIQTRNLKWWLITGLHPNFLWEGSIFKCFESSFMSPLCNHLEICGNSRFTRTWILSAHVSLVPVNVEPCLFSFSYTINFGWLNECRVRFFPQEVEQSLWFCVYFLPNAGKMPIVVLSMPLCNLTGKQTYLSCRQNVFFSFPFPTQMASKFLKS